MIQIGQATPCLPRTCPQSRPKAIMDSAAGHLDGTFVREYRGDLPVRPTPAAKLLNEFPVRLKARARGLTWQFFQNFFRLASMAVIWIGSLQIIKRCPKSSRRPFDRHLIFT